MHKLKPAIAILAMLIAGCGSLFGMVQMEKFERAARVYRKAIRWSDFEAACSFLKVEWSENKSPDFNKLKQVKVASYEVKEIVPLKDKRQVRQIVEITYYKINDNVLKTLREDQLWEYDQEEKSWYIQSGLPDFK